MSGTGGSEGWRDRFEGTAPIFPLPNIVLFPHALLPLHIFEMRYRRMTADSLNGHKFIAMGHIRPEHAPAEDPVRPPVWPMVGLGEIIAHTQLADGRYHLVLRGVSRAMVLFEEANELPYRVGRLQLCDDEPAPAELDPCERAHLLVDKFCQRFGGDQLRSALNEVLGEKLPLSAVCDIVASAMPVSMGFAQKLLEELHIWRRSDMLLEALNQLLKSGACSSPPPLAKPAEGSRDRWFPPPFSNN